MRLSRGSPRGSLRGSLLGSLALLVCAAQRAGASAAPAAAAAAAAAANPAAPVRMRVEYMDEPRGVDVAYPLRFTWAAAAAHGARNQTQSAYQIVVTEQSGRGVTPGAAVVWDSGRVEGSVSQNVPLGASVKLAADTAYRWSVCWWDAAAAPSPASTATSTTGIYTEADWKGAAWIGGQIGQYRRNFTLKGPVVRATAYVIGLGYYKLHMNGKQVSTHELGAFTTFDRRVLYDTLDVTEAVNAALAEPEQAIGLELGNGWYALSNTDPFDGGHPIDIGPPTLRVRLSLQYAAEDDVHPEQAEDVVSDAAWTHSAGPVTSSHIYMGTIYNATLATPGWTSAGFDASKWTAATIVPPPSDHVKLTSHAAMPQILTTQVFTPCNLWQSAPGVYVFDFCQNVRPTVPQSTCP